MRAGVRVKGHQELASLKTTVIRICLIPTHKTALMLQGETKAQINTVKMKDKYYQR